ncbi:MAG: NAD(P)-dependent dehydrogenase (short-subunit alcohol dehydrogenase family), partial [Candidatus Azotimanducaceae bacterium]
MVSKAAEWIDLTGKVAHVTGGAKGIGEAICRALAMAGAKVMVSDVNYEGAKAVADDIGGSAMLLDVTDRQAVDQAMEGTAEELGSLDILVNNAGVYIGFGGPVESITDEMWRTLWS